MVLPLLLLLAFGVYEFARLVQVSTAVDDGAQAAARHGSLAPADGAGMRHIYLANVARVGLPVAGNAVTINYYDGTDSLPLGSDSGSGYVAQSPCPVTPSAHCTQPMAGDYVKVFAYTPWAAADPLIGPILGPGYKVIGFSQQQIQH